MLGYRPSSKIFETKVISICAFPLFAVAKIIGKMDNERECEG